METISAFIDGGGSVLVAASSDIGKSALGSCKAPLPRGAQRAWHAGDAREAVRERAAGLSGPGALMVRSVSLCS